MSIMCLLNNFIGSFLAIVVFLFLIHFDIIRFRVFPKDEDNE